MEEKINELADIIINYSLKISKNERVLITTRSKNAKSLVIKLIEKIYENHAIPEVNIIDDEISSKITELTTKERIKFLITQKQFEIDNYDAFISIRENNNPYEEKNISEEIYNEIGRATNEISKERINKRKWLLLNYPSVMDAYKAKMTREEFKKYALDVMTINFKELSELIKPLKDLMEKTDRVRIVGPNTDISFSIKGMSAIPCVGKHNIPDGELYTAPIKTSVNGRITYNTETSYRGIEFKNISLDFKDGKIISCSSEINNDKLETIFNTDEGARYIGEFSFGLNPFIRKPIGDILYDEKIIGSIHFTPGRCYDDASNNNDSSIHWDLVLIQRKEYGGGRIYFDDKLIREDGNFVLEELKKLNYEEAQ